MSRPSKLPIHPRNMALATLKKHKKPMSAYDLLAKLTPHGVKGPPIVYRALESLTKEGLVHKVQALNSFVACNCPPDHSHSLSVLTVCHGCERVDELHDHGIIRQLESLKSRGVTLVPHAVIELPIICAKCAA